MTKRNDAMRKRARRMLAARNEACHICGQPIDYSLKTPHPRSFEADHVQALARGGADTMTNFRASHRECNSKKRARDYAPIVRRSGALD